MAIPTWDEWTADAQQLEAAFANWCPDRPSILPLIDDVKDPDARDYVLKAFPGKNLTWRQLLERMDLRIWTFHMSEEAWLYYLPAFLMYPRPDEGIIGYDLEIIGLPPAGELFVEVASIEKLILALNSEQVEAISHHVYLHQRSCEERQTFIDGYSVTIWNDFWSGFHGWPNDVRR